MIDRLARAIASAGPTASWPSKPPPACGAACSGAAWVAVLPVVPSPAGVTYDDSTYWPRYYTPPTAL